MFWYFITCFPRVTVSLLGRSISSVKIANSISSLSFWNRISHEAIVASEKLTKLEAFLRRHTFFERNNVTVTDYIIDRLSRKCTMMQEVGERYTPYAYLSSVTFAYS